MASVRDAGVSEKIPRDWISRVEGQSAPSNRPCPGMMGCDRLDEELYDGSCSPHSASSPPGMHATRFPAGPTKPQAS